MSSALKQQPHTDAPLRPLKLGRLDTICETRPDGTMLLRARQTLGDYPASWIFWLDHWAKRTPDNIFLADRDPISGAWRTMTYAQVRARVRRIAAALLQRDLSPERPIAILSGNDIEHALLALAAMTAGIPYAPVSPAYSLISSDFGKLRYILGLTTPGLIFVADGGPFGRAIETALPQNVELVVARNAPANRKVTMFADLEAANDAAVDAAQAAVKPETIAKILFTSGSTGMPKGVINTHGMLTCNQQMIVEGWPFLRDEPPVIVDWLPWSHTFGANHNFGMAITHGGAYYVDDGNPTPAGAARTVRNLREVAPTVYFNVPKGFETLVTHFDADHALRDFFFSKMKVMFYAGAGLSRRTMEDMNQLSVEATGERLMYLTSLGATETAPMALARLIDTDTPNNIGVPAPGVELKLVPNGGKLEARLRGPLITPGYWRQDTLTRNAFDEEGFYKLGDALRFADPNDPSKGMVFDGRVAEDFKLSTGTWVSVGPLRAGFIDACAPYARDVVIAGHDRDTLAVLVFPDVEICRKLAGLPADASPASVLADARVRDKFRTLLEALARTSTGSSTRIVRALLLDTPASLDTGEMTDKGSINQRAVLDNRAALVETLYREPVAPAVIAIDKAG